MEKEIPRRTFTITDLVGMLKLPLPIKTVRNKAASVLRRIPPPVQVAFTKKEGPSGRPSLHFYAEDFLRLADLMANLLPKGPGARARKAFPSPDEVAGKLAPQLGLSQADVKKALQPKAQKEQEEKPAKEEDPIKAVRRQTAVNLTLLLLDHLAQDKLKELPEESLMLIQMGLPDKDFPINPIIFASDSDSEGQKAAKASVACTLFFVKILEGLEKRIRQEDINESLRDEKEKKILEYLKTFAQEGENVQQLVRTVCNYFSLPIPKEYKDKDL